MARVKHKVESFSEIHFINKKNNYLLKFFYNINEKQRGRHRSVHTHRADNTVYSLLQPAFLESRQRDYLSLFENMF